MVPAGGMLLKRLGWVMGLIQNQMVEEGGNWNQDGEPEIR
jgi:hypothetical protein